MSGQLLQNYYIDDVTGVIGKAEYIIIPDGETWDINFFWGEANPATDCHVKLIWKYGTENEQTLAITHTSTKRNMNYQLTGDGSFKLALVLINDVLESTETLEAGYNYKVIS